MTDPKWPDPLHKPDPAHVGYLLQRFWAELAVLGNLIQHSEHLLSAAQLAVVRQIVLEMMLGLNGVAWPEGTRHLNVYLGESQRAAIEKTLLIPAMLKQTWIGQAVALVVIYRWYAPQLVERYNLVYPQAAEEAALTSLRTALAEWPLDITTS